jgi:hypothetical protein
MQSACHHKRGGFCFVRCKISENNVLDPPINTHRMINNNQNSRSPGGRIARFPLLISLARENNGIRRAKVRPYSNNLGPRMMVTHTILDFSIIMGPVSRAHSRAQHVRAAGENE